MYISIKKRRTLINTPYIFPRAHAAFSLKHRTAITVYNRSAVCAITIITVYIYTMSAPRRHWQSKKLVSVCIIIPAVQKSINTHARAHPKISECRTNAEMQSHRCCWSTYGRVRESARHAIPVTLREYVECLVSSRSLFSIRSGWLCKKCHSQR